MENFLSLNSYLKSQLERPLYYVPWLHEAMLVRRPVPDLNKLTWINFVERGQIVLDIGANRGNCTIFFSNKVGKAGHVYAFEPVPTSARILRTQCSGRSNVEAFELALSDEAGRTKIFIPGNDLQQASLAHQVGGSWRECERVTEYEIEVTRLDDWVASHGISWIDFIKLDVEGAEYKVLRGAEKTIRRFRPLIYMEVCRDWIKAFGYDVGELARDLRELGYPHIYKPTIENNRFCLAAADLMKVENGDVLASCRAV